MDRKTKGDLLDSMAEKGYLLVNTCINPKIVRQDC